MAAEFYIENTTTGLGASFFPFNYSYSVNANEHTLSFTKFYLYWNLDEILNLSSKINTEETSNKHIFPLISKSGIIIITTGTVFILQ